MKSSPAVTPDLGGHCRDGLVAIFSEPQFGRPCVNRAIERRCNRDVNECYAWGQGHSNVRCPCATAPAWAPLVWDEYGKVPLAVLADHRAIATVQDEARSSADTSRLARRKAQQSAISRAGTSLPKRHREGAKKRLFEDAHRTSHAM